MMKENNNMARRKRPFLAAVNSSDGNEKALEIIKAGAETAAIRFEEQYHWARQFCGSPIEEILLAALMADANIGGITRTVFMGDSALSDRFVEQETVYIYQQAQVGQYRADFLIQDASVPFEIAKPRLMAVECDGHDFHEKTKTQAQHDKRRDRFFQSKGIKLLRFTGSEIWADPAACVEEIVGEYQCEDEWRNR